MLALKEHDDPITTKSSTDTADPYLPIDLTLNVEPKHVKSRIENLCAAFTPPLMLKELPIAPKALTDKDEPKLT
jgi:hypothetical protein